MSLPGSNDIITACMICIDIYVLYKDIRKHRVKVFCVTEKGFKHHQGNGKMADRFLEDATCFSCCDHGQKSNDATFTPTASSGWF